MGQLSTSILAFALIAALAFAAVGDWRHRIIPNWLNAAIALSAPLWWWAEGWSLYPDIALQLALATIVFALFAGMFALGAMGGGDVKLLTALALWFPLGPFFNLLAVMAILGGVLTIAMMVRHRLQQAEGRVEVPYGIAIAVAGMFSLSRTLF